MTAPAAPVITAHNDGFGNINIRWTAVAGATSYRLDTDFAAVTGLTGTSYVYTPTLDAEPVVLVLSAFNAGAEQSAYSNQRKVFMNGQTQHRLTTSDPFGAYDRRDY